MMRIANVLVVPLAAVLSLSPLLAAAQDSELAGGKWVEKGYSIRGQWKIVERDEQTLVVFDEKFKTRKGPDLYVYLSRLPVDKLKDRNVESSSVRISPLKSNKGAQEYVLPDDLSLEEFQSVVVHCKDYSHLWGGGAIE